MTGQAEKPSNNQAISRQEPEVQTKSEFSSRWILSSQCSEATHDKQKIESRPRIAPDDSIVTMSMNNITIESRRSTINLLCLIIIDIRGFWNRAVVELQLQWLLLHTREYIMFSCKSNNQLLRLSDFPDKQIPVLYRYDCCKPSAEYLIHKLL